MPFSPSKAIQWALPANPNPDTSLCFQLCVPNDPAYIAAFFGQIYDLGIWNYWKADGTNAASVAANKMKQLYRDLNTMGNCHEFIRQNTTDPCLLEKSDDGGTTWTTFAQLDFCPPSIITINGKLYFRNPTTGVLTEIGATGSDPRTDGPPVIPYPGGVVPPGQTAECLSATNAVQFIKDHIEIVINNLNASASFAQTASGFLGFLVVLGEIIDPINIVLTAFLEGLVQAGAVALSAAFDDTNLEKLKCILNCHADSQGGYNAAAFTAIENDIDAQIGLPASALIELELETLGFQGLNRAATSQKIASGDCSGCDCGFTHIFNFADNDGGFMGIGFESGNSTWDGTAWINEPVNGFPGCAEPFAAVLQILKSMPASRFLTTIQVKGVTDTDHGSGNGLRAIQMDGGATISLNIDSTVGVFDKTVVVNANVNTSMAFYCNSICFPSQPHTKFTEIIVKGHGSDPF